MTIVAMVGISGYLSTPLSAYLNQNLIFEKIIGLEIVEPPRASKLQFYNSDIPRNSKKNSTPVSTILPQTQKLGNDYFLFLSLCKRYYREISRN